MRIQTTAYLVSWQRSVTKRLLLFKHRSRVHVVRSHVMIGWFLVEPFKPVREHPDV